MRLLAALCIASMLVHAARADVPASIQELVFSQKFPEVPVPSDFVYCLGADGEDISLAMLARLQRAGFTIVLASECTQDRKGSTHTDSGRKAIFYRLSDFATQGTATATVEFETYHHGSWASGATLRLEFLEGVWVVAGVLRSWDS